MTQAEFDVLPLRVIRVRSNGKRDFDRRDKRRLVEACLQLGVSVAGMALQVGINTNQLRKWIRVHQMAIETAATRQSALPVFVPVVEVSGVARATESPMTQARASKPSLHQRSLTPARLTARLPNGATVELECGGQDIALVKAMIEALGAR